MAKPLSQAITFRHMVLGLTRILADQLVKHLKGRVEVLVQLNFCHICYRQGGHTTQECWFNGRTTGVPARPSR